MLPLHESASPTQRSANALHELPPGQILRIIFDYTAKIADEQSLQRVLSLMADMGQQMILADRCAVWLIDHKHQEVYTTVAHGTEEIRIPIGSGFVGYSIQHGEPLLIEDASADYRHNANNDHKTNYLTRTVITVPFVGNDGHILGAYQAVNKQSPGHVFTQRDLEFLTLAASYAGKSLESVMLHEEIVATQKEILLTMGQIGESRSKETGNHVKRVAEYSYLLALGMGLDSEQAELLKMASPMHDIGKVAIPDSVLHKPGKLTAQEFELMKEHTVIGYRLLNKSNRRLLRHAARIAHEHHERWDGSGYPRGIQGEAIDLFARITAVADVFDALGSERVYKPAWELDRILALLQEERGRHFDPLIIDVFMQQLPALLAVREQYRDMK
ncbi:HD domain-containing phosphohydrolase [Paenibacillus daejeonensis]|uniref:HD domain-containing phosphohydrolase n=1 Tax=Paenibacillus daejeonensis TaxID=135193 RepID=UPI001FE103F8|nr:HD domain-containing phosphohydrolase [Paenibacillus daejeonensis]